MMWTPADSVPGRARPGPGWADFGPAGVPAAAAAVTVCGRTCAAMGPDHRRGPTSSVAAIRGPGRARARRAAPPVFNSKLKLAQSAAVDSDVSESFRADRRHQFQALRH